MMSCQSRTFMLETEWSHRLEAVGPPPQSIRVRFYARRVDPTCRSMTEFGPLVAPVLMGGLLLVLILATARIGRRRIRTEPDDGAGDYGGGGSWSSLTQPRVVAAGYVMLALGLGGLAGLSVSGTGIGAAVTLIAAFAVILVGYVGYGSYAAARSRGLSNSQAILVGTTVLGLFGIAAIAANLLAGS